ncbi:unnamed protein product, partial [Rotaria magnacalcarata]
MHLFQQQQQIGSPVMESQYDREHEEGAGETHVIREEILQKPSATEIELESPHESDHEEEDQYHPESVLSSDAIRIEHTETVEHDQYEPMVVSQQQQYIDSTVIDSQYDREHEEGAGETDIVHEEILQKTSGIEIELESPHESDREEDEAVQYQLQQNLTSDQILIESPHIAEDGEHELSSSFEVGTIHSHQIIERRPNIEQDMVESSATIEPHPDEEQYEQNYESDQHAPEYRTAGEVTKTESATQDDEKPFEESVTPQQEFVESPLQATPSADEKDDYSHSRETSADDTSIIEPSAKGEEYGHQLSFENKETDELHVAHEFEILQKSSPAEILLESPHETDHEKEDQYDPESLVSSDAIKIEHTETVEHEQYEPMLLSQQQQQLGSPVLEGQYEREEVERAGETHIVHEEIQPNIISTEIALESLHESDHEEDEEVQHQPEQNLKSDEITIESSRITERDQDELGSSFEAGTIPSHQITERRLSTEQVVVESSATSEPQKDEEQYDQNYESGHNAPEYRTTAEVTKTESTTQEDEESFEESVTPEQEFVESNDEQDDYYDSRETSAGDTNMIEPSAIVTEYGHQSLSEKEKDDELQAAHEFETLRKSSGAEIQLESPHESEHEKED